MPRPDDMWKRLDAGERIEVDLETYDEFLDILPPRFMSRQAELFDGSTIQADYGFGEGSGPTYAFWRDRVRQSYFAQRIRRVVR